MHQLADTNLVLKIFYKIEAFKSFNLVVKSCLEFILQPDFAEPIENFKKYYLMIAGTRVKPKITTYRISSVAKDPSWEPIVNNLSKLLIEIFINIGQGISETIIIQSTKKDCCAE